VGLRLEKLGGLIIVKNLSDKEKSSFSDIDELRNNDNINFYHEEDVKEFIKDLKNELDEHWDKFDETTIDKLAGDKLI